MSANFHLPELSQAASFDKGLASIIEPPVYLLLLEFIS